MDMVMEEDIRKIADAISYQNIENKVFLIAGANGFLASSMVHTLMYLNRYYLTKKCTVVALCRNKEKAEAIFREYLQDQCFHLCIQGVEEEIRVPQQADYIIHAASSSSTSDFKAIPAEILKANVIGTYNLLEFAHKAKVKGFLYFSSGAVYGEAAASGTDIKEDDYFPLDFLSVGSCYAEGKRAGEAFCKAYWKQYGIPAKIIRISHTYGPGIDLNDGHVYSDFIKNICDNKPLFIKGSGSDVRAFCYITDAAIAFFRVLFYGKGGEAYNMANCKETVTIRELAERLVCEAFPERGLNILCSNSGSEVKKAIINVDKLKKLNWEPQVDIVEGFRRTVKSFEERGK